MTKFFRGGGRESCVSKLESTDHTPFTCTHRTKAAILYTYFPVRVSPIEHNGISESHTKNCPVSVLLIIIVTYKKMQMIVTKRITGLGHLMRKGYNVWLLKKRHQKWGHGQDIQNYTRDGISG